MTWATGVGIISGKGDGMLDPTGTATRAEVAVILARFVENVLK
ncbi:MAG: S-layer homology domain-containing protein [Pseudoflavonifractor sp.]